MSDINVGRTIALDLSANRIIAGPQGGEVPMTELPHALKRIRLNLARSKEFSTGSARHGYEFVAPLDASGHIEPALWVKHREHCRARGSGMETRTWDMLSISLAVRTMRAGCSIITELQKAMTRRAIASALNAFRPGECVSICDGEGKMHTFQVSVELST